MSKPHVLVLPAWYPTRYQPLGGIFFKEQAVAVQNAGAKVGVIYPDLRGIRTAKKGELRQNYLGIETTEESGVTTLRSHGWALPKLPQLSRQLWLYQAHRLFQSYTTRFGMPDLVHAHSAVWAGVAAAELKRRYGVPYVLTEHSSSYARGLYKPWQRPFIRTAFQQADYAVAVSEALAKSVRDYIGAADIAVIPNMVDTDYFQPPPEPRKKHPFRFLAIAFLTANKGIDVLLQAFAKILETHPNLLLEVGGDGEQREALEATARALGVERNVSFLGPLSRDQVRDAMWRANCFVSSSRVETFGIVLIEAMATGLPVVATRSGGPDSFVTPAVGHLVAPDSVSQLAAAMQTVYETLTGESPAPYSEVGSRDYAVRRFHSGAVTQALLEVYARVIKKGVKASHGLTDRAVGDR